MQYRNAAIAFAVLCLSACGGGGSDEGGDDGGLKDGAFSLFDPVAASPTIPFPFDGFYSGFTDPTLNIPNSSGTPFVTQANLQDGFSTTASLFTDLLGPVDFSTLNNGLRIINSATGAVLTPGVDYTIQPSPAISTNPISGAQEPISSFRSRLLIEPLKPFAPSTRYIVVLTKAILSEDGVPAEPSELFTVVRSGTPVAEQTVPVLNAMSPTQKATLETLRSSLIRPIVVALGNFGIAEENIVLAWSFTTQSVNNSLAKIQANSTASQLAARNTGATTNNFNPSLPPVANVYVGTISLPYYLAPATDTHSTDPLTRYWLADPAKPDLTKTFLGQVPCGAFAQGVNGFTASESTTLCYPEPAKRADVTVPLIVTLPNANSGRTMPESGWPVVIFQHGITSNRSSMLAIAPALSMAGFAVVAIDLPLHGLPPGTPGLGIPGVTERTFALDLVSNTTGAAGSDGTADASGTHFINLSSLITSRDNLRQAVADLIVLTKSVPGAVLLGTNAAPDGNFFDGSKIRFVGHSLGGIVGGTLLGVNGDIGAASLAMPGGGIAKLLDASKSFGPRIKAGLEASTATLPVAQRIIEGTDNYETFMRFAQTLTDSADPINYAVAAATAHPIHMIEVIGDKVVPNVAEATEATASYDKLTITGYLSGTEPLYAMMGLTVRGPYAPAASPAEVLLGAGARSNVVQFSSGDHSANLIPATDTSTYSAEVQLQTTLEMQRETASFLASNGLCLPLGGSCP